MKTIKINFLLPIFLLTLVFGAQNAQAQEAKPNKNAVSTFQVLGVCGDCKARIEKAARIKGVKYAEWNKANDALKVIYNEKKVELAAIQQAVADIGHDTQMFKADSAAYNALPGCCQYRDEDVSKH